MSGELSRRAVLGGAVTGVAGALLSRVPVLAATPPVTGSARQARVGGTLNLRAFPSGWTFPQAVQMWNWKTGTQMRCWKIYYEVGQFGTTNEQAVQTMIQMGIQALISVRPSIKPSRTDRDAMMALLNGFKQRGLQAEVCLWQEVGPKDMTAAQYHCYVNYYGPYIRQVYPLVFDGPGWLGPTEWQDYAPNRSDFDGYAVDYYCSTFWDYTTFKLEGLIDLAGPLPIGIWEIGNTASPRFFPTTGQIDGYMSYLQSFLTQRLASGLPVGSVAWYNGPHQGHTKNEIVGTDPNPEAPVDISAYDNLYRAVNQIG
jgi:hypothetical protein